ncbi:phage integrase SAM-like domain-containing protein [Bacteroides hominis]|uniref:phage integrase SAM-like domain-containing protein n=1 Tax=Bacteroides hominis TaxID=2763023 RepID=UPI003D6BF5AE
MATLSFTILTAKPTAENKFPVLLRISAKKQKAYIKTEYQLNDVSEWYNGKVVARTDAAMMNKRLSFELKKYTERLSYIENNDCYTASQLKTILIQQENAVPSIITFNDFMRNRIKELLSEGRESYAKMNEDTLKVFEAAEGDVPMIIMNHITIEHFDRWMKANNYSDGGRQIRLCHIKARINGAIKNGLLRCETHPFAYTKLPTPDIKKIDIELQPSDFYVDPTLILQVSTVFFFPFTREKSGKTFFVAFIMEHSSFNLILFKGLYINKME